MSWAVCPARAAGRRGGADRGHYDHFGIGAPVNGDSIYNGAQDNASGTAAMLTAAEAFARSGVRPERSIVFVGFAAEESGLLGSRRWSPGRPIPLSDIAAILNMDVMNLYGRTRDVAALGLDQSTLGRDFTAAAARKDSGQRQPGGAHHRALSSAPTISPLPGPGCRGSRSRTAQTIVGQPARMGAGAEGGIHRRALPSAERRGAALVQL